MKKRSPDKIFNKLKYHNKDLIKDYQNHKMIIAELNKSRIINQELSAILECASFLATNGYYASATALLKEAIEHTIRNRFFDRFSADKAEYELGGSTPPFVEMLRIVFSTPLYASYAEKNATLTGKEQQSLSDQIEKTYIKLAQRRTPALPTYDAAAFSNWLTHFKNIIRYISILEISASWHANRKIAPSPTFIELYQQDWFVCKNAWGRPFLPADYIESPKKTPMNSYLLFKAIKQ